MIVITTTDKHPMFGTICNVLENIPMPTKDGRLDTGSILRTLDCDMFNIVDIGHGISCYIDDEGLYSKEGQYNWPATALRTSHWCKSKGEIVVPCNYPPIHGAAALLGSVDEDGNQLDLTEEQVNYIKSII